MDWIVVKGVKPWDGRYQLDLDGFELTTREWGFIKRLTGYLPLTVDEGFQGGDPELFAALAAIALRRAGRVDNTQVAEVYERIADAPAGGTVRLESDRPPVEEDDAGPPAVSTGSSGSASGDGSTTSSETSPPTRNGSGIPASAGSESQWARSAT
jgi:hypothetical protein